MKAVLTGHTRGLGAAIAAHLLSSGIPVLGLARARNAELEQRFPALLQQVELDLSDSASLAGWLAGDTLGKFLASCKTALLINNAATVQPMEPIESQDPLTIARAVALNVAAPLMLANAVAVASHGAADRRILHISSGASGHPFPSWSIYCASKAALDHHARAVATDKTRALRICSLAPGVVDTDMQAEIRGTTLEQFPLREMFEAMKRDGQLSSPEECAKRVIDHLLSEEFGQEPVAALL